MTTHMNLGHLAIPRESAGQEWLRRQGEKRQEAVDIVKDLAQQYFSQSLPEYLYDAFAAHVVADLDQRL